MKKVYEFTIDNETYKMSMKELAENITRDFAKNLLSKEEYEEFCETQEAFFEAQRKAVEEYARNHYIYDELRDAM